MMIARQRVARVPRVVATVEGAILPQEWEIFGQMNFIELTNILKDLATHVNLTVFMSHSRGPKKHRRKFKRILPSKRPHVSTAKILSKN